MNRRLAKAYANLKRFALTPLSNMMASAQLTLSSDPGRP